MSIQSQLMKLNLQYRQLKEDAKKLMLRGELKSYVKKLILITMVEDEYRQLVLKQLKAA